MGSDFIKTSLDEPGVAEVVVDRPPVNALPVSGWWALAETLTTLGRDPTVRVIVLRAAGRGFNAGVDIKELRADASAIVAVNRACFAAFAAVYDCPVPVIAAVHGFCLGGGVGLAGNADLVIASEDAYFGLPEVDRGALGAATHLSRLVPQQRARAMMYTCATAGAAELHAYGSVLEVVPEPRLRERALAVAGEVAGKHPALIRAAKEAFNGIDLWDVKRSYRYEQGFTYEVNLSGVARQERFGLGD